MKFNLFSRKSSIFLLGILAIVLLLSLFAKKSTISEGYTPDYTTSEYCVYYYSHNKSKLDKCIADYWEDQNAKKKQAEVDATAAKNLKVAKNWVRGDWYNNCTIDYNNTTYQDIVFAKCRTNDIKKVVYKDAWAHYKDCKKYANNEGVINLINNNGKLECDRKIYK